MDIVTIKSHVPQDVTLWYYAIPRSVFAWGIRPGIRQHRFDLFAVLGRWSPEEDDQVVRGGVVEPIWFLSSFAWSLGPWRTKRSAEQHARGSLCFCPDSNIADEQSYISPHGARGADIHYIFPAVHVSGRSRFPFPRFISSLWVVLDTGRGDEVGPRYFLSCPESRILSLVGGR